MNVAIRISSPGNDGPVSQTNLAVAVGAGSVAVAVHPPQVPAIAFPVPSVVSGVPSALSDTLLAGMTSLPVTVAPPERIWLGGDMGVAPVVDSIVDVFDLPHVLPPLLGIGTTGVGVGQMLFPSVPAIVPVGQIVPTGLLELGTRPSSETLAVVSSAAGRSASASASSLRAREKPAPRWRAPRPLPIQETAPSGASIAPATGGGSSGGGIPIFLALPFLAAMLDLARRVTLDHVALPSGHRSRMPENPG